MMFLKKLFTVQGKGKKEGRLISHLAKKQITWSVKSALQSMVWAYQMEESVNQSHLLNWQGKELYYFGIQTGSECKTVIFICLHQRT